MLAQNWLPFNTSASGTWLPMFSASWSVASRISQAEDGRRLAVCPRALGVLVAVVAGVVAGEDIRLVVLPVHSLLDRDLSVARHQ
jgi:hypothetical protein